MLPGVALGAINHGGETPTCQLTFVCNNFIAILGHLEAAPCDSAINVTFNQGLAKDVLVYFIHGS